MIEKEINNRFIEAVKTLQLKFPISEIAEKTGYSQSSISPYLSGKRDVSDNFLQSFCKAFNLDFGLIRNGPNQGVSDTAIDYTTKRRNLKNNKTTNPVKFYNVDFVAGSQVTLYEDDGMISPAYEMDIPEFAGCVAFRAYSDSMDPLIKSGSILFSTKVEDWASYLEYGQVYGIIMMDGRRFLKYIKKASDKEALLLHSY